MQNPSSNFYNATFKKTAMSMLTNCHIFLWKLRPNSYAKYWNAAVKELCWFESFFYKLKLLFIFHPMLLHCCWAIVCSGNCSRKWRQSSVNNSMENDGTNLRAAHLQAGFEADLQSEGLCSAPSHGDKHQGPCLSHSHQGPCLSHIVKKEKKMPVFQWTLNN